MSGPARTRQEIEAQVHDIESKKRSRANETDENLAAFGAAGEYDQEVYAGSVAGRDGYFDSLPNDRENEEEEEDDDAGDGAVHLGLGAKLTGTRMMTKLPQYFVQEAAKADKEVDVFADTRRRTIAEREDEYHQRRTQHMHISPERPDPFLGQRALCCPLEETGS